MKPAESGAEPEPPKTAVLEEQPLEGITGIAAGGAFTVLLMEDGTVQARGWDKYGQCTVPADVAKVKAVSAGGAHSVALMALLEDGTVRAWGDNEYGQCDLPAGLDLALK